jgi:alpha-tubulin suppressor-like RCC1 family protein
VNAGTSYACGLTTNRKAYCWGSNFTGQLGDGTRTTRFAPVPVAGGRSFRQLRAGADHTCGVTTADVAFCWGGNDYGQIGDGTTTDRLKPVRVPGGLAFAQIRAGGNFTCGQTTDGRAFCWGRNEEGQVGDGTTQVRHSPTPVQGGLRFTQVVAGGAHACGVATDRRLWCWGRNEHFELGDGTQIRRLNPQLVASGAVRFTGVSLGVFHSCALATDNRAYCWGDNAVGSLGEGTFGTHTTPAPVSGNRNFGAISVGAVGRHGCGVTGAGVGFCWGWNGSGQLGDGTQTDRNVPVKVVGPA